MKGCWPEGALRAYLDGEMPAETRARVASHLELCAECNAQWRNLSARAARVSSMVAELAETSGIAPLAAEPAGSRRSLALAVLALAASVALAVILVPRRGDAPRVSVRTPVAAIAVPAEPPPAAKPASTPKPQLRRGVIRRPAVLRADFLRLDDEPLETGTVVRVSAEHGDVQADLIVGPDGRAHAIRVVNYR